MHYATLWKAFCEGGRHFNIWSEHLGVHREKFQFYMATKIAYISYLPLKQNSHYNNMQYQNATFFIHSTKLSHEMLRDAI